jgi:hypothetical protein
MVEPGALVRVNHQTDVMIIIGNKSADFKNENASSLVIFFPTFLLRFRHTLTYLSI